MELDVATARAVGAALTRIAQRNVFFGALVLRARLEASERIPTAATDGRDIFVNPAFFNGLPADQQEGLLLHEVLHAALAHVARRGGREPRLWNIAADAVINGMLAREGYALPPGGVREPGIEQLSTEEAYAILARGARHKGQSGEDLLEQAPGDASGAGKPGEQPGGAEVWAETQEQARAVAAGSVYGKLPAGIERELAQVGAGGLDWRARLWRYLARSATDFQGFDRRFLGDELYLDALENERLELVIGVDTSGSIDRGLLATLLGEVQAILRAYPQLRCELCYADSKLYGPYLLTGRSTIPPPVGGGGTDFRPFFAWVDGKARRGKTPLALYLTDGHGRFPQPKPRCRTLWVVTPGGAPDERFPFGEVVRLLDGARTLGFAPPALVS
jgi:predicted metal-dependent peptidase